MGEQITTILNNAFSKIALSAEDIVNILFSLFLALIIGIIISQVYKYTQRGMNHELSFMTSLVLLAPIIALVMLFIRGDLILSLGLIGSLSIIRFRTPIKDTRDMVYLFWSIVVGLGAGTYNWAVVVIGSILILAAIIILNSVKYGQTKNLDYVLVLSGTSLLKFEAIDSIIQNYVHSSKVRSQELQDDAWEMVLELDFKDPSPSTFETMIREIKTNQTVTSVSLLAPQLSLPA